MSASSKKKLRNAENAAKMTEKQLTEQKEAKKLKMYTIAFGVVIGLMVVLALWVGISGTIENSGIRERSTVAATIGEHEISNAELNYFYIDAVNQFYSNYGSYASIFGLDLTKPLNEQVTNEEEGTTWADDFLQSALDNATAVYALVDAANAAGYTLPEDEQEAIDSSLSNLPAYAAMYGYTDADSYLKAMYGKGANEETLKAYYELTTLADSYYNSYSESLTYTDDDLRAAETENYNAYSAFTYNYYYLSASSFREGGTTDEEGTTTYSDEEIAAAEAAAKAAADSLAAGEYASLADFDAAIAALEINAESTSAASIECADYSYSNVNSLFVDWMADENRAEGDVAVFENVSHTHADGETHSDDEDTSAYDTVNGYYVVYYRSTNDNVFPLANVRHILVKYTGGTTDDNGNTTYSDEEKAMAKAEADALLAQWQDGEATEDSFAALANENSDDGDGTTGGLYEDVYPGQMVTNFNDWCFEEGRKAGDTGVVETEYGYHVMYYAGDSDVTYRDYQIRNTLNAEDTEEWYVALLDSMEVEKKDFAYISTGLVLSAE